MSITEESCLKAVEDEMHEHVRLTTNKDMVYRWISTSRIADRLDVLKSQANYYKIRYYCDKLVKSDKIDKSKGRRGYNACYSIKELKSYKLKGDYFVKGNE